MSSISINDFLRFLEVEKATDFVGVEYILAVMEDEGIPSMLKIPLIMHCISEAIDVINEEYEPKKLRVTSDDAQNIMPTQVFIVNIIDGKEQFWLVLN